MPEEILSEAAEEDMRRNDTVQHPEAVIREATAKRRIYETLIGAVIAFAGVVAVVSPILFTDDLKTVPAIAGIILVGLGCIGIDKETFGPIFQKALDVLPWGKKS